MCATWMWHLQECFLGSHWTCLDAVDVSHHLPLACVGSIEQRVLDLLFGWLWEKWYLFGICPETKMSGVTPLACTRCKVAVASSFVHLQFLCIVAVKCPTQVSRRQLGHRADIASPHGCKSDSVCWLLGHCMVDHSSFGGKLNKMSWLIFCPNAVSMPDRMRTCMETQTQFSLKCPWDNPSKIIFAW